MHTLQGYPRGVLGGWAFSYGRGTPVGCAYAILAMLVIFQTLSTKHKAAILGVLVAEAGLSTIRSSESASEGPLTGAFCT